MRVALDTNRLTDLFQGDAELANRLGEYDEVWLPLMVLGELQAGFHGGSQQHRYERLLRSACQFRTTIFGLRRWRCSTI